LPVYKNGTVAKYMAIKIATVSCNTFVTDLLSNMYIIIGRFIKNTKRYLYKNATLIQLLIILMLETPGNDK
jgi:hypothetical protein